MKTRRVFQTIAGALCLLVPLCLMLMAVFLAHAALFPSMSSVATELFLSLQNGFETIAGYWGMTKISYVLPIVFYAVPSVILVVGGIMLLVCKGKRTVLAGCVLALTGIAIASTFTIVCAMELVGGYAVGVLAAGFVFPSLFVVAVGCTLGIKPKQTAELSDDEPHEQEAMPTEQVDADVTPSRPAEEELPLQSETVEIERTDAPQATVQTDVAAQTPAEREPQEAFVEEDPQTPPTENFATHRIETVQSTMDSVYGKSERRDSNPKLTVLQTLLDSGAISQQEYDELARSYR